MPSDHSGEGLVNLQEDIGNCIFNNPMHAIPQISDGIFRGCFVFGEEIVEPGTKEADMVEGPRRKISRGSAVHVNLVEKIRECG